MRLRFLSIAVFPIVIFSIASAELYPVTGDSTAVRNEIDLLPAESHNPELVQIIENVQSPDNTTQVETPVYQQTAPAETPATDQTAPSTRPAEVQTPQSEEQQPASANQQPWNVSTDSAPAEQSETAAEEQTPVASGSTDDQPAISDTTAQPEVPPQIIPGTIIITSVPDSVDIVINDVSVGSTPYHAVGFYPGIYEIVLHREGYEPFVKQIDLKENGTEFITGNLSQERGSLYVSSMPDSASVLINDSAVGVTPFASQPLVPGMYRLRVEAAGHTPYTEQITISPKLSDTLQVSLLPLEKPKFSFTGPASLKKSRTLRRITFGSAGAVGLLGGFVFNEITKQRLTKEREALANYREAQLNESTYTQRYSSYINSTKATDRSATGRNILYTLGIIGGIGFAVSLPF